MHISRAALRASTGLFTPALIRGVPTRDSGSMMTYDRRTVDSTGAFLIGELERLDPTVHEPLVAYTWSRDVDLREDVTMGDEVSSFTQSSYAANGGVNPNGKNWIGLNTNAIAGVGVDTGKVSAPLHPWGMELSYTVLELERSLKLNRPVDAQKLRAIQLKWNMDLDEMVYVGEAAFPNCFGLLNSPLVATANVPVGASGSATWATKTPDEILADVNGIINAAWAASGWTRLPNKIGLPPAQLSMLVAKLVSAAGSNSILKFIMENNLTVQGGGTLDIVPMKWLIGGGAGGTRGQLGTVDRMIAYTQEQDLVRMPLVQLQRTPLEYRSIYQMTTYYGQMGQVEFVYPETLAYRDGI